MAPVLESSSSTMDMCSVVTQEILVMAVFFGSLFLWKSIKDGKKKSCKKSLTPQHCPPSTPPKKPFRAETRSEVPLDSLEGSVLPAIRAAEAEMMKLLDQREFTRALNLLRKSERDGHCRYFSEAFFASFTQSAIRVGKIDVMDRLLHAMKHRSEKPTSEFWRTTLKMLSSRKHFDGCLSIYASFGRSLAADKVVFSCLINAALDNGTPEHAAAMLDRYQEADLDPKDYVICFRTYVATRDVESAARTFDSLGEKVTSLMLNLLLSTCVNAKQPERAFELLHKARALQESRASSTENTLKEDDIIVDVVSYNTVVKGFAQAQMLPRCFDCLHEMRAYNLEPDDVTFGTLLDLCVTDSEVDGANEVVNRLMDGDKPADTVMCSLFIKGLVWAHKLPKALEVYEEMKRRMCKGARPDIATYSVLIKAFVDAHDLEKALMLVADLTAAGHTPDDIILTHLLEGCRYVGNHALGKRLFSDLLAAGVNPSDFTLIAMVKLHGRCGAHDEAYSLVEGWEKKYGLKASVIHYTCLMSGCLRTKNYDQAWKAYQLMTQRNVQPDSATITTLIPGMVVAQNWERVLVVARHALKSPTPISIAPECLNSALAQLRSTSGDRLLADELESMMREANIRISARTTQRPPPGLF